MKKWILAILLIAAFAVFALGSGEETDTEAQPQNAQTQGQSDEQSTTAPAEQNADGYGVGETAVCDDVTVTLVAVTESTGSQFNKPGDGNVFVLCEFEIANDSDEEMSVSSMLSFEGYCDDYSCSYSLSALMEKEDKNQLDGNIAPGKKMNGVIGYEVPEDWQELEVHFTPDVWSDDTMVFVATNG